MSPDAIDSKGLSDAKLFPLADRVLERQQSVVLLKDNNSLKCHHDKNLLDSVLQAILINAVPLVRVHFSVRLAGASSEV